MGTQLVAWYDIVLTSYPGQTTPEKVVLLPDQDRTFTIVTEDGATVCRRTHREWRSDGPGT